MWRNYAEHDEAPQVLETLDLAGIAKYMKSDTCKNIFIMAGAGISTSAGIPDFRSPDTGLYANLARLNLPYPEAVFDIQFFQKNPRPFYVLAHELAPGKFRPTLSHSFIRLLAEKKRLHTCFTQNIDTLERRAGVPSEKIIEAHGSFADQHCVKCGAHYPHEKIKQKIADQEIPTCEKSGCKGYVKPDIVFFGESLPPEFSRGARTLSDADLLIVMGTSLTVYPFASLTELVPQECPRILLNLDHVGGWGSRVNDVACLMRCDNAVRELCKLLDWEDDLLKLWAETEPPTADTKPEQSGDENIEGNAAEEAPTKEETLQDIVDNLAEAVGKVKLDTPAESESKEVEDKTEFAKSEVEGGLAKSGSEQTEEESETKKPIESASSVAARNTEVIQNSEPPTTPQGSNVGGTSPREEEETKEERASPKLLNADAHETGKL